MTENELSYKIIGAAIEVHKNLGVGLLESAYETALAYELRTLNLNVKQQVVLPLQYKEIAIENAYKIDLIVEDKVIVEVKSVLELHPIFHAQVLTYLKQTHIKLGLLINFNSELIKYGIHRIVNKIIDA
ncbi:GxxExxY protein [Chryseobacterium jejuense]|jgi:GxxExxY protein|uniref:GxxExxY protein n=1 Tax=Chryseobacterium jejuense TaxID=445960 RepID=UPI001AE9FBC7|nr:GxxExxY protein [Chryseobacterium jejuense]MBP2616045.1 GxxExxY protein [Chryseobacterium jejuense]